MFEEKTEKTKFKPRLKAEFSMGQYDYERFHELLKEADVLAIKTMNGSIKTIIPYYSVLKELYRNFRPIMFETGRKKFDALFKDIKDNINWSEMTVPNPPFKLKEKLENVHTELLEIRQIMGLGIEARKDLTQKKKWERALRISKD